MIFLNKLANTLKEIGSLILMNERVNSQRCVAKDRDTTKTIIDSK